MANISVSLPADGETIDAADYNTPINTIVNDYNGGIDNSNIAAAAAIAGSKLADSAITTAKINDASITNAKLSTAAGELGGAPSSWTPTLTAGSFGTGATVTAGYTQVGKWVTGYVKAIVNSTGISMGIQITPPVTPSTDFRDMWIGGAHYIDTSASQTYLGTVTMTSADRIIARISVSGTSGRSDATANANPFTWATGDTYSIQFKYLAA